jgi:hypothetical protein
MNKFKLNSPRNAWQFLTWLTTKERMQVSCYTYVGAHPQILELETINYDTFESGCREVQLFDTYEIKLKENQWISESNNWADPEARLVILEFAAPNGASLAEIKRMLFSDNERPKGISIPSTVIEANSCYHAVWRLSTSLGQSQVNAIEDLLAEKFDLPSTTVTGGSGLPILGQRVLKGPVQFGYRDIKLLHPPDLNSKCAEHNPNIFRGLVENDSFIFGES